MSTTRHPQEDLFATTRWSTIRRAHGSDTTAARAALAELCQTYWPPLYAYARRTGCSPHDAEDATQGFFARLLRLESLAAVSRERGKFRAFLLASLKHYLADQRDAAHAQRRDSRATFSLDAASAEARYLAVPADTLTPEELYDRQWALTLLDTVMQRLALEYQTAGRARLFDALRYCIAGEKSVVPTRELAAQLSLRDEAVRVNVHRLRQRYRAVLREELAHTVGSEAEVMDELRELRRILSR